MFAVESWGVETTDEDSFDSSCLRSVFEVCRCSIKDERGSCPFFLFQDNFIVDKFFLFAGALHIIK